MKIKTKLVITFCIILFLPIFLASGVIIGLQHIQEKAITEAYGLSDDEYYFTNSIQILSKLTEREYDSYLKEAINNPYNLLNVTYLDKQNELLKEKNSYLVVKSENGFLYNGGYDNKDILWKLPSPSKGSGKQYLSNYYDSEEKVIVKQLDFVDSYGNEAILYIITSSQYLIPEIKTMIIEIIIAAFFILLLTGMTLVLWVYRSIINPIRKLQLAAERIKEGDLDFEIEHKESDGEIGDLCVSFEKMRERLKTNAEEKIRNESENRVLISNIAHDLKTPITAVKGYSEGIMDGVANTPEKLDKYIRTIYNKATEMDLLINELTLYSKIDTNRIPYNFAKINVSEYFSDCVEEIGLDLEAKKIGLSYNNYVEKDVFIIADPEQLKRVIHNIVGNSIKYMNKDNGFISIRINDVGDFIQVEMEDNGQGIASKDLPYIFDRFYRADASRNSATGGSGIGLSIVKKIIEDHGGKIWATSKENSGTIMYFVIRKYQEVINE